MNHARSSRCAGFTLIELIITLVLMASVAAMVVPFFGSGVDSSTTVVTRLHRLTDLNTVLENILADFESTASTMVMFKSKLDSSPAQYIPSGMHATISTSDVFRMNTVASPALSPVYDTSDALRVTVSYPEGGALTYVLVEKDD